MAASVLLNWSGGKDAALALYHLLHDARYHVTDLLTSVSAPYQRVAMHGVRVELLEAQARHIGLPLKQLLLPDMPDMAAYEQQMAAALAPLQARGITHAAFGDIFLEDLRLYREQQLAQVGLAAVFPLWQRDSLELLREFWALGFRAVVVCVNEQQLDQSFCGRLLDEDFVRDLPPGVDPCGENGEFHSFVFEAPYFQEPVLFTFGEQVRRTYPAPAGSPAATAGFWFQDLLPA
ncbi:Dph6-related ATP pyrophosphatase [Hymenobacter guriensis]|uniref:Diphthine--ammonia ligase n=1 Tax=Hymenobacter guriensis TaxID=2793065 RepID=A0ABS0L565_9BACT|nr:diphthine--ammonia ligase [Hymenobacter guriensis]MBG8555294.1 diphthine--ammonia ligase [Hymenobacter guriensis]